MSCLGAVRQQTAECPVAEHELKLSSFFREPTKQFCVLQKEAFQLYNHRWKSNIIKQWKQTTNKKKSNTTGNRKTNWLSKTIKQSNKRHTLYNMSTGTSNKQKRKQRKNWKKIGWASAAPFPQYHCVCFQKFSQSPEKTWLMWARETSY